MKKEIQLKCLKYAEKVQDCLLENHFRDDKCLEELRIWRECLVYYSKNNRIEYPEFIRNTKKVYPDEAFDLKILGLDEVTASELYNSRGKS